MVLAEVGNDNALPLPFDELARLAGGEGYAAPEVAD
jgi:hypothetical protein